MLKTIEWTATGWEQYVYWQMQDKKTLVRINKLIDAVMRELFAGIGKPETLRENLSGCIGQDGLMIRTA